jgi:uncharacterized membrane protein YiaA
LPLKPPDNAPFQITKNFSFRRNSSWLASVKIALVHGIWNAPISLFECMKFPVASFLAASGFVVMSLGLWVLSRVLLIGAALCGFLVERDRRDLEP